MGEGEQAGEGGGRRRCQEVERLFSEDDAHSRTINEAPGRCWRTTAPWSRDPEGMEKVFYLNLYSVIHSRYKYLLSAQDESDIELGGVGNCSEPDK